MGALREGDPDYIRRSLRLTGPPIAAPEIGMFGRAPGHWPVLLVDNHSRGNVAPDTLAFHRRFGTKRHFAQLPHGLVIRAPWLSLLRKYRTIGAGLAPEPRWISGRPFWSIREVIGRHICRVGTAVRSSAQRGELVRQALTAGVLIVPIVSIGGQEMALFRTRGERLAPALPLDRRRGRKRLPVAGQNHDSGLEPIDPNNRFGARLDVNAVYESITTLMQRTLDELAAGRRWPVLG